jgi:2-polyprenyl-3-methyl-5-hydroxy-6-metoxy-1,4-benzoquinol methylase
MYIKNMDINEINKNSWNKQAARYQADADFLFNDVDYGDRDLPTEKDLNLIGNVEGKKVLEIGCGGANCGISLAKQGAIVTCSDISKEQIGFAKNNAEKENVDIKFIVSAMEKINYINEFDVVILMAALSYIEDIDKVFNNVSKSLKNNGLFVFSLNDPTFYSVAAKYLWDDPENQQSYFYCGPEIFKWNENDDFEFITYRRPIYEYINCLTKNSLYIEKFYQLKPEKELATEEDKLETIFPRMMVFKTVKQILREQKQ